MIQRQAPNSCFIFGKLTVNGLNICITLENPAVLIPAGEYNLTFYNSPHAGHVVPLVNGIPNRDFVEIHCGNHPCDSKGCILVGLYHTDTTLLESQIAFGRLMSQIKLPATLRIVDAPVV